VVNETARIAAGDCSRVKVKRLPHGDYRAEFGELIGAGPTRAAACRAIADHAAIRCCLLHPVEFIPVGKAPENPDDGYHPNQRREERAARRASR
jgi:hypothetical protein